MDSLEFDFCRGSRVIENILPEEPAIKDMNGWDYTPRPALPIRRRFKVTLEGLTWYFRDNHLLDTVTNSERNAGRLEEFYAVHRKHVKFLLAHEWMGLIEVRFENPVSVPKAIQNSGGLIEPFELTLIHHNPRW